MNFIILLLVFAALLDTTVELLNLRHAQREGLPKEFIGFCDEEKYRQSQSYLVDQTRFGLWKTLFSIPATIAFFYFGGFQWLDTWVRNFQFSEVLTGVLFVFALGALSWIAGLPFSLYRTFVLEEKYGFNKTTAKTFMGDTLKGLVLSALIGAPILALVFWFFSSAGSLAWLYVWMAITVIQIFLMFLAPVVIMPIFNTFIPMGDGALKQAIEQYARSQNFQLQGIFTMDGSKRSSKANAFFTGFGKFRRIVLFDTLIKNHTVPELVAVMAHEVGHFKRKHVLKFMGISIFSVALMLYVFSLGINSDWLFSAFQVREKSVYASLVFLAFLYSPISTFLGLFTSALSRKFEYEADAYARVTTGGPQELILALKKLSVDNLSNLNPHPWKVFLEYSHPPVLQRIRALREKA